MASAERAISCQDQGGLDDGEVSMSDMICAEDEDAAPPQALEPPPAPSQGSPPTQERRRRLRNKADRRWLSLAYEGPAAAQGQRPARSAQMPTHVFACCVPEAQELLERAQGSPQFLAALRVAELVEDESIHGSHLVVAMAGATVCVRCAAYTTGGRVQLLKQECRRRWEARGGPLRRLLRAAQ